MKSIDARHKQHWDEHGYIVLRQALTPSEALRLSGWIDDIAGWPEAPGKWMKWYESVKGSRQLCRIEDFLPYHAELANLLDGDELGALLTRLLGEPATLFKEKVNFKLPGGAGFQPHQDAPAFTSFGQRYHVTVMLAVDAATLENGCLEIVDGFHGQGQGLLPQTSEGTIDPAWVNGQVWKPIEAEPGDLVCFDSYLPHRSGPNRSDRARRALYVTYNRACDGKHRDAYFARKRAAFPPECERVAGADYSAAASVYNLGNPIS